MATKLFLRDSASDVSVGSATNKLLSPTQGSALVSSDATATVSGPTSGVQVKKSGVVLAWFSRPLNAVTISGTVTFNLWGLESATQANCGFDVLIERCDESGNVISTISRSERGTEMGTSASANNWTATPTSTTLAARDRIKVTVFANDAGGNMGNSRTFTFDYGAATGVDGDSYVQFNEAVSESTAATVTGAKGTFTETGIAAALKAGYKVTASQGSIFETGNSASVLAARKLTCASGSFAETGNNATLTYAGTPNHVIASFTATDGTELSLYTGEFGATFQRPATYQNAAQAFINSNKLTKDSGTGAVIYYASGQPGRDCSARALIEMMSSISVNCSLVLRLNPDSDNYYHARHNRDDSQWSIRKSTNGTPSTLATVTDTLSAGDTRQVEFTAVDVGGVAILRLTVGGVVVLQTTDASPHPAGRSGVRFSGAASSTTGYSIDNFESYPAYLVQPSAGAFTETGNTAGLKVGYKVLAQTGTFAQTGNSAGLSATRILNGAAGAFAESGSSAGTLAGRKVTADASSFSLTGNAASLIPARRLSTVTGSVTEAGQAASLLAAHKLLASAGLFTLNGQAASLLANEKLSAQAGAFALTANDAALIYSPVGHYTLAASPGAFNQTGNAASLLYSRTIAATQGSFSESGKTAALQYGRHLASSRGDFIETGVTAALKAARRITTTFGGLSLQGTAANFLHGRVVQAANGSIALVTSNATMRIDRVLNASGGALAMLGNAADLAQRTASNDRTFLSSRHATFGNESIPAVVIQAGRTGLTVKHGR